MTEPVAYKRIYDDGVVGYGKNKSNRGVKNIPLYTAEQLRPRVKMTQAEFDEFNSMPVFASVYGAMLALYSSNVIRYSMLLKRFSGNDGQIEFANLWFYYHIKHKAQGELIEIVPETKWFVRSKEKDIDGDFWYLKKTEQFFFRGYVKENSTQFETKEEAEKWTNPLTEAVQLPVEEK